MGRFVDTEKAQTGVIKDCSHVLPEVCQVWEGVASIVVATKGLQSAPDSRKRSEETEKTRITRITLCFVRPTVGVETEEELDILKSVLAPNRSKTMTKGVNGHNLRP